MSILQSANVHFDSSGLVRIGKDGSNVVIKTNGGSVDIEGLNVDFSPAFNKANAAYAQANSAFDAANNAVTDYSPAFNKANAAYAQANAAFDAANNSGGSTITDDTTTNSNTNYLVFANTSSGSLDDALISTTKLYYNPSTGQLNATNFNSLSDREKKDNIEVITDALNLVNNINGVRFTWKDNGLPSAGLIAQELKTIMPELVGDDMSVNYSGVIGLLVECIKELKNEVELLKNDRDSK